MAIIPWKPFWDIERFFEEEFPEIWERPMLSESFKIRMPKMDIYEENNNVIAEVELPGFDPKDIETEIKDNYLKIVAKKEEKKEEKEKDYYKKELSRGYFKRVVPLPSEVKSDKAEAEYKDGILKIIIPKVKSEKDQKGTKVKIKTKT